MSRDDGMFTGAMSSTSPTRLVPPSTRRRRAEAEEKDKHKLDAKAESVLKLLEAEKQRLTSVKNVMFDENMTDVEKVARLQRTRDQYEYVESLEKQMKKILGVTPVAALPSIPPMPHEDIPPMPGEAKR